MIDELDAARPSGHRILEILEWARAKRRDQDEWNEPRVEPRGLEYERIRIVQPLVVLIHGKRRYHCPFHVIYLENPVPVHRAVRNEMHVRIEALQLRVATGPSRRVRDVQELGQLIDAGHVLQHATVPYERRAHPFAHESKDLGSSLSRNDAHLQPGIACKQTADGFILQRLGGEPRSKHPNSLGYAALPNPRHGRGLDPRDGLLLESPSRLDEPILFENRRKQAYRRRRGHRPRRAELVGVHPTLECNVVRETRALRKARIGSIFIMIVLVDIAMKGEGPVRALGRLHYLTRGAVHPQRRCNDIRAHERLPVSVHT